MRTTRNEDGTSNKYICEVRVYSTGIMSTPAHSQPQSWARRFWSKKDQIWRHMLQVINRTQIEGQPALEEKLNAPVPKPANDWSNWLRKWQYRNQRPVREQQARTLEQMLSGGRWNTVLLAFGLRKFSPNELCRDDNWCAPSEVGEDPVIQMVGQLPPDLPFPLHSPAGLEWFFSVRLGCWCLEADHSVPGTRKSAPLITAKFDTTDRYPVKPGIQPINMQIWFTMDREHRCLRFQQMHFCSQWIDNAEHPLFDDASRAVMCAALTDVSIRHHAIHQHLLVGDIFASATYTCLCDPDHPIRRVLQPFCFGVWDINNVVRTVLLPRNGTVHSLFGLSYKGLKRYLNTIFNEYHMSEDHVLPLFLEKRGLYQRGCEHPVSSALPAWQDANEYWEMFVTYVAEVTQAAGFCCDADVYADEAVQRWGKEILRQQPHLDSCMLRFPMGLEDLRLLLVIFMFHSTVGHELSSQASELVATPYAVTTQWRIPETRDGPVPLEEKISTRDVSRRAVISGHAISLDVKKLNQPWGYLMYPSEDSIWRTCPKAKAVRDVMNTIPTRLRCVEELINERNRLRQYPHDILHADELNCSLSV